MEKKSKLIAHKRGTQRVVQYVVGTTQSAYSMNRDPHDMCRRRRRRKAQPLNQVQPGLFFSSTPELRPKKAILRRIHTVSESGLARACGNGFTSSTAIPGFFFFSLSRFAFFRRLHFLLFSCVFVNSLCQLTALFILYFYISTKPSSLSFSILNTRSSVNWPPVLFH